MRRYFIAAALVALVLPAAAVAKGPVSASISGPALERSLTIRGDGEGPGTALGALADASGFAQMFSLLTPRSQPGRAARSDRGTGSST
jgi:hypothetical protein